jgi:hypothetical protein
MVTYHDKEYQLTKLIKQGKSNIDSKFQPLADWINKTYDVQTMNVIYDIINPDKRPRLQIIFEFGKDKVKFLNSNFNFDSEKQQAIADQFIKSLQTQGLIKKESILSFLTKETMEYKTDDLLVVFSAFEPIARDEANESVPIEQIQKLKEQIANKDIWEIKNSFSAAIFFFYTEVQVESNSKNGVKEELSQRYYDLLKQYDEFDYFKRVDYSVLLDSKENFDNKYQSNWFYYFR